MLILIQWGLHRSILEIDGTPYIVNNEYLMELDENPELFIATYILS